MLSGNTAARSYDNATKTWNGGRPIADRVSFVCLASQQYPEEYGMKYSTECDLIRAQLQMPSCWDGVNAYKSDNSHVAYLSQSKPIPNITNIPYLTRDFQSIMELAHLLIRYFTYTSSMKSTTTPRALRPQGASSCSPTEIPLATASTATLSMVGTIQFSHPPLGLALKTEMAPVKSQTVHHWLQ